MFLKQIKRKSIFKLTTMPIFLLASFLSILFSTQFSASTYAATYINLSILRANVDFQFNQAENAASAFKEDFAVVEYNTNNVTGFTAYVSSIDEDTNLNHTDSSVTQKITSITSPSNASSFSPKNWGYLADQASYSGTFKPIPKASQPEQALNVSMDERAKFFLHFGVKTGSDLPAGTYSKKILVTAITNRVPTTATLKVGIDFVSTIGSLDGLSNIKEFKRSTTAPTAGVSTKIASIPTSEMPVYLWYDTASKTVFWWSDADTVYANEDSSSMFSGLGDVEKIDMDGINTSRVKNMSGMFFSAKNLYKEINLTNFDTSNVEDMSHMFGTYGMKTMENLVPIDFSRFNTSKVKNMKEMFSNSFLPSLDIRSFDTSNVENMERMFDDLEYIRDLDLSGWNVKKVNNVQGIFSRLNKVQSLNLSGWQMDSVTNMRYMFSGLANLTSLNLSGFTTKNVIDMSYMFAGTKKLTDLDLSSFDTSKVTDMRGMFSGMSSLPTINLSNFDTSQVTNMSTMFKEMGSLSSINLSSFDTRNVTDMSEMFSMTAINPPISSLDLSSFNTSNVTNMFGMFQGMSNLTNLNIQSFDTRNVTNMKNMFYWSFMTPENSIIDLSSFDTRNVTDMSGMFFYTKAKTIYASPSFVTTAITTTPNYPFMSNPNLTGVNGTTWDWSKRDHIYARIDTPGNPGFFTRKP